MKYNIEEYRNQITKLFIFKINHEIKCDTLNQWLTSIKYECRCIIFDMEYIFTLWDKGHRNISCSNGKHSFSRIIRKDIDVVNFIYAELLNIFSKNNKAYIKFDEIKFI